MKKISFYISILIIIIIIFLSFLIYIFSFNQKLDEIQIKEIDSKLLECKDCNIIIIGLTNVRKDHLSGYGYFRDTTPNIDKFFKNSVIFNNFYSSSSWTLPSYTSIMTSLYPIQHKVFIRNTYIDEFKKYTYINESVITLIDVLNDNNYLTFGFNGGFDLLPKFGISNRYSYNFFEKPTIIKDDYPDDNKLSFKGFRDTSSLELNYGSIKAPIDKAKDFLIKNQNQNKFFMYIQGFDAHCPFEYPELNNIFTKNLTSNYIFDICYWTFDRSEELEIGGKVYYNLYSSQSYTIDSIKIRDISKKLFSLEDIEYMKALYDGEINLMDNKLNELFLELENNNYLNNTIVILMSEHGDLFGEHGRFMRGGPLRGTFYQGVINVPLMVYIPNLKGRYVRNSYMETIDIAPTILDILNISIPNDFYGISQKKTIISDEKLKNEVFAGAYYFPVSNHEFFNYSTLSSVYIKDNLKLIKECFYNTEFNYCENETYELYDLNNDPLEKYNLNDANKLPTELIKGIKSYEELYSN